MVQITSLFLAAVLVVAATAQPVAFEKRQGINFGSGNGIGNGNFKLGPCKRLAPGNYGSGNILGSGNGIVCSRDVEEEEDAEKRQLNFLSGNQGGNGNFKIGPCSKRQVNGGSGNSIGNGNGILCTRDEEEAEKRQFNVGSGNSIGDGNFQYTGTLPSLPSFPKREGEEAEKRQINFGSGNGVGNGNFKLGPCKRLAAGNYGSGNILGSDNGIVCTRAEEEEMDKREAEELAKRQNIGSGNGIGNGNFKLGPCKRQLNLGSGNLLGSDNGIFCTRAEEEEMDKREAEELAKRQNIGSGNGIGNGNFHLGPCKRQLNLGSGNILGSDNGIACF